MPEKNPVSANREAAIAESWQRTLSAIPTLIGRLAYLASLRNVNTGSYEHFGLAQRIGEGEVDRMLRRSHVSIFQEWLCFGLERQKEELEEYFSGLEGDQAGNCCELAHAGTLRKIGCRGSLATSKGSCFTPIWRWFSS